ncbi:MAG TPA: universal stress protein [Gaiellaceae bacterium]|nr:universal stress protein [Gaiellaceae bacterium]
MYRNILVAIDGSQAAAAALDEAIDIALSDGSRLTLISVAAPPRFRMAAPPYVPHPTELDLERGAWNIVRRAEQLVPPDIPVTGLVRAGDPAIAIPARAEQGEHDLVVIGSRGHGWLASLFLGSVSREVAARSPVPVRVVSAKRERRGTEKPEPRDVYAAAPVRGQQAKPATMGETTVLLWVVFALLAELELAWWFFDRMYAP